MKKDLQKMMMYFVVILVMVMVVSSTLCLKKDKRSIVVNGMKYVFSTNIYEADKVYADDPDYMRLLLNSANKITILYNSSGLNETEPFEGAYIEAVSYNIVFKLSRFYALTGWGKEFDTMDVDNLSENITYEEINFSTANPGIYIYAPSQSNETSVTVDKNIIHVRGTTYENLKRAGDKLSLIVFNVDVSNK